MARTTGKKSNREVAMHDKIRVSGNTIQRRAYVRMLSVKEGLGLYEGLIANITLSEIRKKKL